MKFTYSWLKDHLETEASLNEIVDRLTSIGLEVENVDDRSSLGGLVIAKVVNAQRHPDADKLQILEVDTGDGRPIKVVCGAPNARTNLIGVFAPPGSYIPGLNTTLSIGKIRGVESFGMMCSESELELSDIHDGIIELAEDAPIGGSFAAYAGLDDPVIDVSITPNRPDCTGVRGIARDLAAANVGTLKPLNTASFKEVGEPSVSVEIDQTAESFCLGYAWRTVSNLNNGAAPLWMQRRLLAIGLRPINALVDVTNYLTFDLGRPLHVFDTNKVNGNLTVRAAKKSETIHALNGKVYSLNNDNYVIADESGVESIAGIIGGEGTGCDMATSDILLESALWDPSMIAHTGRMLAITSDARYRFERGVDPNFMESGLDYATAMIAEFCGGTFSKAKVVSFKEPTAKLLLFRLNEIKRLSSLELNKTEIIGILERLGFEVKPASLDGETDQLEVVVPSWRPDIEGSADLVEEIIRIYGVDLIKAQPLEIHGEVHGKILTPMQIRTRAAKRALAARGMSEVVLWSFISHKHALAFNGGSENLQLANPIAADMSDMRPSLLPGLISAAQRNADRGYGDVALFEVSDCYSDDTPNGQHRVAAGIRRGTAKLTGSGRFWAGNSGKVDIFDAKTDALTVLQACGVDTLKVQIEPSAPQWYHPGRSGAIKLGPKVLLGYFGEFHPDCLETLDVTGPLCGFEIFLDNVPEPKAKATKTRPPLQLSPYQAVKRDFAFVIDKTVDSALVMRGAINADKKNVQSVQIFDVFESAQIGENKKSVAIEVSIQPSDQTLTDEELENISQKIIANVTKITGGSLR